MCYCYICLFFWDKAEKIISNNNLLLTGGCKRTFSVFSHLYWYDICLFLSLPNVMLLVSFSKKVALFRTKSALFISIFQITVCCNWPGSVCSTPDECTLSCNDAAPFVSAVNRSAQAVRHVVVFHSIRLHVLDFFFMPNKLKGISRGTRQSNFVN